ncbi:MAG: cystathionine gamma-lyase [Alphaproteobacteria bacterium]|nr:MAG: cystathionine gamma-lyase [Alphaproteobacteria bacterium]
MNGNDERALRLLHRRQARAQKGDPVALPLTLTSSFHLPGDTQAPFSYARFSNPTLAELEEALSILEEAEALMFPSGMATISAVIFALLAPGDRVLFPADGYYAGRVVLDRFAARFGIEADFCPTAAMGARDPAAYRMVFLETPSNPGLDVCDIAAICARKGRALVVVDNTTATPYLQRPLDLGADLVLASDTKAANGHSDLLAGHIAGRDAGLMAELHAWRSFAGGIPGAFEAWALHRGLQSLEVRLERMCRTAGLVAERLAAHPAVAAVRYPGLASDPSHAIASRQMAAAGFVISFTLADADTAERFIAAAPLTPATSFGGLHSSAERRARWGDDVAEGFIRLSIGCEPAEALWAGLAAALDEAAA